MQEPVLEFLQQYTELGIALAAINIHGAYIENDKETRFTKDIEAVKEMINGKYIFKNTTYPKGLGVKIFRFIPKEAGLFCLDFDIKNGINGVENFKKIAKRKDLDLKGLFNETTFVKTPSSGYHFYFNLKKEFKKPLKDCICKGVEVKYNKALTAAGSVKNGVLYALKGELKNALPLPATVLNMARKKKKIYKDKRFYFVQEYQGKRPSLNALIGETVNKVIGNNNRAFDYSLRCLRLNYTEEQAKEIIYANPDIFGVGKDLATTIKSAFSYGGKKC